jgi:hypothetical protein
MTKSILSPIKVKRLSYSLISFLTPRVGFEPTTNRLTADRSTTELPRKAQSQLLIIAKIKLSVKYFSKKVLRYQVPRISPPRCTVLTHLRRLGRKDILKVIQGIIASQWNI